MQLHEADAGSRNPYSLAWGITAGLWWLLYTFEEPHETGAAGFIQLVDTGICQHLGKHLAYLILQDQVDAVAVQLRMAGQDLLCPCGVLLQASGYCSAGTRATSISARSNSSCFRRLGRTARPMTSIRPMFSFLMWWSFAWGW